MKKKLIGFISLIALLPSLSACNEGNHVIMMNWLDNLSDATVQKLKSISGGELRIMLDTKQDFVLYFSAPECGTCQKVEPYFTKFVNSTHYLIYSYSTSDAALGELYRDYPNIFNETPKTMFFKNGELNLTISSNKYNDENMFLSTMSEFCDKSNMYSGKTASGINYFLNNFNNYFVYVMDKKNSETYTMFSEKTYRTLSTSSSISLIIDASDLESGVYSSLMSGYGLDSTITSWAIEVENKTVKSAINYLNSADGFNSMINEI